MNCLKHHIQPSIPKKPGRFVIQCNTNDLTSDDTREKTANDIIQLGKVVKTENLFFLGVAHGEIVLIKKQMM